MDADLVQIDELLMRMWDEFAIQPTLLALSKPGIHALTRLKFPPLPRARTSNMRRLRKLKYRRNQWVIRNV